MRALVTGASGFIGRWVARLLSRAGADLVMAVRDPVRARAIASEYSIEGELVAVDLGDRDAVAELLRRWRPSVIFNLAAYGVDPDETDEAQARRINADLPLWLAEGLAGCAGNHWPGTRLVHAGSALEYGTAGGNLDEDGPATPTTRYGKTKLAGTRMLLEECQRAGLRALVARLFTVYGPGENEQRLLPALVRAAENRERIALTSGKQKRDFTFVRDAAEGLLRLGASAPGSGIVNLATGRLTTVRAFIEAAAPIVGLPAHLLDFGGQLEKRPEIEHDPVSIDRLRELTGWQPPTTLSEGIRLTVSFPGATA